MKCLKKHWKRIRNIVLVLVIGTAWYFLMTVSYSFPDVDRIVLRTGNGGHAVEITDQAEIAQLLAPMERRFWRPIPTGAMAGWSYDLNLFQGEEQVGRITLTNVSRATMNGRPRFSFRPVADFDMYEALLDRAE